MDVAIPQPAKRTYDELDEHAKERITDKLDAIVTDQWRTLTIIWTR